MWQPFGEIPLWAQLILGLPMIIGGGLSFVWGLTNMPKAWSAPACLNGFNGILLGTTITFGAWG